MRKNWIETSIGDIADVVGGGTPSTGVAEYWGGNVVWLTPTEVVAKNGKTVNDSIRKITVKGLASSGAQLLPPGSVVLTSRASVGFAAISECALATNQGFQSLVPGKKVLAHFLMYWIHANRHEFDSRAAGSTFKEISKFNVKAIKLYLPPLSEQRRIVDLISTVDSYIDALQYRVTCARKSRNAVLYEILNTGGDDWTETTLGQVGHLGLFSDGDWVESKDQDPDGNYRLLQLADIGDGIFLNKSNRWLNEEQFSRLSCTKLKANDLLIARMPEPVGRACLMPEDIPRAATVVDVAIIRTNNDLLQKILVLILNEETFRAKATSLLTGTTRQRVSRSNLSGIDFRLPPIQEQERIVDLISVMDEGIGQTKKLIAEAKLLRSSLILDLLNGEHDIPENYDLVLDAS
jgi:restriction endonuclease S subunit